MAKGSDLVRLIKAYVVANPQAVCDDGIVRKTMKIWAHANGWANFEYQDDSIGGAVQVLKNLGVLVKSRINGHFLVNDKLSPTNQKAYQVLADGGTYRDAMKTKRIYTYAFDPEIGNLYYKLKAWDKAWRNAFKKHVPSPDETPTMTRESWTRRAAINAFTSCQVTGECPYVNGKDNGVDSSHILPLKLCEHFGFKSIDSPHGTRLLRVDIHRKNDSGVSLVKDNPALMTPAEYRDSHAAANELREWLEELKAAEAEI